MVTACAALLLRVSRGICVRARFYNTPGDRRRVARLSSLMRAALLHLSRNRIPRYRYTTHVRIPEIGTERSAPHTTYRNPKMGVKKNNNNKLAHRHFSKLTAPPPFSACVIPIYIYIVKTGFATARYVKK